MEEAVEQVETTAGPPGAPVAPEAALWEAQGRALGAVKEHLTDLTVDVVLAARAQYLAGGANAIKHWPQIADRVRAAARTTEGPEAWCSKLLGDLKVQAPTKATAGAVLELAQFVRKGGERGARAWLELVQDEVMFIIAQAQLQAEERAAARAAKAKAAEGGATT